MQLSPEQLEAVTRSGQDACCAAGPGSGKTRVLVERIAWLVEQGKDPGRILAITFTEKAAKEIKSRLVERFAARRELRERIEHTPVSTIHGFCRSLLAEYALSCGLDPSFQVLDEREARTELHAALRSVLDRFATERRREFRALLDAWSTSDPLRDIAGIYEQYRQNPPPADVPAFDPGTAVAAIVREVTEALDADPPATTDAQRRRIEKMREWLAGIDRPDRLQWLTEAEKIDMRGLKSASVIYQALERVRLLVPQARAELIGATFLRERATLQAILAESDAEYRFRKRKLGAVDFGDLEEFALALLRSGAPVDRQIRERYDAVLMDEAQDTNPIQWSIIDLIRRPDSFFAVGDINQSIYGFRGADPALFGGYEADLRQAGLTVDTLEENYRSRPAILDAVSTVLPHLPGVRPHRLVSEGDFTTPDGVCVELIRAEDSSEPLWVARRIRELVAEGPFTRYSDYAVLARATSGFEGIEAAFEQFRIPFVLKRGRNFFEEPEVLDLVNCLRVLDNPADRIALLALLRSPLFGVPDEEIYRLHLDGRRAPGWVEERVAALRRRTAEEPASLLLAELLDETAYLRSARPKVAANVRKLLRILRQLEARFGNAPGECLRHIDEIAASGDEPNAPASAALDAVQVLSVHAAKGLEFPVVFLIALHKKTGGIPSSLNLSPHGLGIRWRVPGTSESLGDSLHDANRKLEDRREQFEEDRLLYVAMTRAKERLVLTWTQPGRQSGPWAKQIEAAFSPRWPDAAGVPVVDGGLRLLRATAPPDGDLPAAPASPPLGEIEVDPLPPAHHPPASTAVTSLVAFTECPRRYFLSNLCGWPQPDPPPAASFGSEVHAALAGQAGEVSEEARTLVSAFKNSPLGRRAAAAKRAEREFDFLVECDGLLLTGSIDLWFEDEQGCVLVDYKTDRELTPEKMAAYTAQLEHYAQVLARFRGAPPGRAALFLLRQGSVVDVPLDGGFLESCSRRIAGFLDAHRSGSFPMRTGERCRFCPHWRKACSGLEVQQSARFEED